MKVSVSIEGFRELDAALGELPKAIAKGVMRRVLSKAATPIAEAAARLAPEFSGELRDSIAASTKLSKRQARKNRKAGGRSYVEVYAGAGVLPQAHLREFGADHHAPEPFMRPAWDGGKDAALEGIKGDLAAEIDRAATRIAKKQARLIAKNGG